MKNKDFIEKWINYPTINGKASNLYSLGLKLMSYNTCICQVKIIDGNFHYIINATKYTASTTLHQKLVKKALDKLGISYCTKTNVPLNSNKLL